MLQILNMQEKNNTFTFYYDDAHFPNIVTYVKAIKT